MIVITLPWPDRRLSPNAREHWAPKAKIKAWERFTAKQLAQDALAAGAWLPDGDGDISLELIFCPPSRRKYDRDNSLNSMKSALDGVADGLGIDDNRFEPIILRRGEVTKGGMVIARIGA